VTEAGPWDRLGPEVAKLRNDIAAAEVIGALRDDGIRSILLKGPSVARWLYRDDERRIYGDIDLLVSPGDFERAEALLAGLGFEHADLGTTRPGSESHHEIWKRPLDGAQVELHRTVLGIGVSDQAFWDEIAAETEMLPLGVGEDASDAEVPAEHARALLVGLHAAQHGPVPTPLNDLERALAQVSPSTWERAGALARRLEADGSFRSGLSLLPQGRAVAADLALEGETPIEARIRADDAPRTAIGWEHLHRMPGVRGKARYLARELVPTPDVMRLTDPAARRGRLGLTVAYLRRPLILVAHAPKGFQAWRRAARAPDQQR
jgi:hypothetical protein